MYFVHSFIQINQREISDHLSMQFLQMFHSTFTRHVKTQQLMLRIGGEKRELGQQGYFGGWSTDGK